MPQLIPFGDHDQNNFVSAASAKAKHITPAHLGEWVNGSGISEGITRLNLESIDDPEKIALLLNWKSYRATPGWFVRGIDPETGMHRKFGQFKPNEAIQFPDSDKPQKYLSFPKDAESETICLVPDQVTWQKISDRYGIPINPEDVDEAKIDSGFWRWVLAHPSVPITLTEGAKKAACLLSQGYCAIALTGVWNGQRDKKLIRSLEIFVAPGREFDLVFDADIVSKESVQQALKRLGNLLIKARAIVRVVLWDLQLGKGCDDFIVAHGAEKFESVMQNRITYEQWLNNLERQMSAPDGASGKKSKHDIISSYKLGSLIAEEYLDKLAYNNESQTWMRYEAHYPGVWSPLTQEYMEHIVVVIAEGKGVGDYGSHNYILDTIKRMRSLLIVEKWQEPSPKELLPFQNHVLEVATGKVLDHSPHFRFTWSLPRQHNPLAVDWKPISDWLDEATGGDAQMKRILLCWLNAVLKGRSDLHTFLNLTGPGGTGKGTFFRLAIALVGERNNHPSDLKEWNENRFEGANAYLKRLVTFADEDKYSGGLGRFKKLTGDDPIRGEEKGRKAFQFTYDGMVMVASNYPIFVGDTSSGMARRKLELPFTQAVSKEKRRNLNKEFIPYLDALTNYLLAIPDEEVTATLLQIGDASKQVTQQTWEHRMRTDSIAAWLNECCIHDPKALEPIGSDKDNATTLFGNYFQFCSRTGGKPKGLREFSPSVLELCNSILNWDDVRLHRTASARFIKGLRLRDDGDRNGCFPIEQLWAGDNDRSTRHDDRCDDGSEAAPSNDSDGCDGSKQLLENLEKSNEFDSEIHSLKSFTVAEEGMQHNTSLLSDPSYGKGFNPSSHPSVTDDLPVTENEHVIALDSGAESVAELDEGTVLALETDPAPVTVGDAITAAESNSSIYIEETVPGTAEAPSADPIFQLRQRFVDAKTYPEFEAAFESDPINFTTAWDLLSEAEQEAIGNLPDPVEDLVNLILAANTWQQVKEAIAINPEHKQAAWQRMDREQRERIHQLKFQQQQQNQKPEAGLQVGSRVSHSNSYQKSYGWHGTVVALNAIGELCHVLWDERHNDSRPYYYLPSDLRRLDE